MNTDVSFFINNSWQLVFPAMAKLVAALVILLIGILAAKLIGWLVTLILKTLQLDLASKQVKLDLLLEKGNVKKGVSDLLGDLVYWVLALTVVIATLSIFGLNLSPAVYKIMAYVGVVFLAAFILGAGLFLASLIAGIVRFVMANLGLDGAPAAARIVYYIVIVFAFLAALSELGISTEVFVPQIGVIIGAFGLAAAIAFGLGCKDMAADFLHNMFKGR